VLEGKPAEALVTARRGDPRYQALMRRMNLPQ
jgi:hypothetical protein